MARSSGGGWRAWWWDLPLRRKGLVVVALPALTLIASMLAALVLNAQQASLRDDARVDTALQGLAASVQRDLLDLENAVLVAAATGETALLADWDDVRAGFDRDVDALVDVAHEDEAPLADDAAAAARDQIDRVDDLAAVVGDAAVGDALVRADLLMAAEGMRAVDARFDALTEELEAHITESRAAIDRRSTAIIVTLIGGMVLAAAVGALMIVLFTRGIVQRISSVGTAAESVLAGNYDISVEEPAKDELGNVFSQLYQAAQLLIEGNAALERSRDAERDRLRRERVIRDVSRRVHEAVGQHDVLSAAVCQLGTALGADRALVAGVDADGRMGELLDEWAREGLRKIGVGRRLPADPQRDANFAKVIHERQSFVIGDVATAAELLPQTREMLGLLGVGSFLFTPVIAGDEPLAALLLLSSQARPWPAGSERLAEVVAGDVATALTHARLYEREREMVDRLRELDQAKSDFVASVSHELRTPLTSIRGYVEMLTDGDAGELGPEQRQMLSVVQRNADRLLALIEDLLSLSRIESGSFRVVLAPVSLADVVATTVAELRPQAAARGVTLVDDVAPDVPDVLGDAAQLERILLNLLSNAIKFTADAGTVTVSLRGRRPAEGSKSGEPGEQIELTVADAGIGIPEAEQDRLFSRFFRSSTAQERAIQGTGLGLVIVKSIVDHHGGDIAVRSRPGEGTTFTVRLPAAASAPVAV